MGNCQHIIIEHFTVKMKATTFFLFATITLAYLATPAFSKDKVTFAFVDGKDHGYQYYNWTRITDIGFWTYPKDEVITIAKQNNVGLWQDSHLPDAKDWGSKDKRKKFAKEKVKQVQQFHLRGVFFDFEGHLTKDQKDDYTKLAKEVNDALKPLNASIFVCVGGRPTYEFRDYDYKGLADNSEFLFIMGYDMHFWDDYTCVTKGTCSPAEASIKDLKDGVTSYLKDVSGDKLVLGLPWYGQLYQVIVVPWNMGQIAYKDVLAITNQKHKVKSLSYDDGSQSWKLECNGPCTDKHKGNVIWYDDAKSLTPKYALARDNDLLGVGCWEMSNIPVPDDGTGEDPNKKQRDEMMNAFVMWNV